MAYFMTAICQTTTNGNPNIPPTTLGPFKDVASASTAANLFQEQALRMQCCVRTMIYADEQEQE